MNFLECRKNYFIGKKYQNSGREHKNPSFGHIEDFWSHKIRGNPNFWESNQTLMLGHESKPQIDP